MTDRKTESTPTSYRQVRWPLESDETVQDSFEYWNDREVESAKPFDLANNDDTDLENYLEQNSLSNDLKIAIARAESVGRPVSGSGVDLASGVGWAIPILLNLADVSHVQAVEFSTHRIFELTPLLLEQKGVSEEEVTLINGDVNNIMFGDDTLDFVVMVQAYHHIDPEKLLPKLHRAMKNTGIGLICSDHIETRGDLSLWARYCARFGLSLLPKKISRSLFSGRTFLRPARAPWRKYACLSVDQEKGDVHYRPKDYRRVLSEFSFDFEIDEQLRYILFYKR